MEAANYTQAHLVKEEQAREHKKTFTDSDKACTKAAKAATDNIYSWRQPGAVKIQAE